MRDPRIDPQPGDIVKFRGDIQSTVISRNRGFVTAHDGKFTLRYTLRCWRQRTNSELAAVLHTEPPK